MTALDPASLERRISALESMLTQIVMDKYKTFDALLEQGTPAERLFAMSAMGKRLDKELDHLGGPARRQIAKPSSLTKK